MTKRDAVLTPELVKILKIFIFSSLGLVLTLSFFNDYRADNTGEDRTFRVNSSNRLYFLNVRAIHYDREVRRDAGMTLFRHGKRAQSEAQPSLDLVILLNAEKEEAYAYFELKNAEWPIQIRTTSSPGGQSFEFANGNNFDHLDFLHQLRPVLEQEHEMELLVGGKIFPLWPTQKEKQALKSTIEDYFRLLNQTN